MLRISGGARALVCFVVLAGLASGCRRAPARHEEVVYVAPRNVLVIENQTGFTIDRVRIGDCGTRPDQYRVATTGTIAAGASYELPLEYVPACFNILLEHMNRDSTITILGHQTDLTPPGGTVWEVRP